MSTKYRWFLLAFLLALGLDQGSKAWARSSLRPHGPITVVSGYFDLTYSENSGIAFSVLRDVSSARWLFVGLGFVALGVLVIYLRRTPPGARRLAAELGLVAGGAVGNLIDRAVFSKVTDFIFWHVGSHPWPVFNIADAALLVGVVGLLFDLKPNPEPRRT